MILFLVRGLILKTTAVHAIQTSVMIVQPVIPSRNSKQSPLTTIDVTDTGSKNEEDKWVWPLSLEMRECGPVSGNTAVVHIGIPESLQGSAFGLDWQVRPTLFCWWSYGAQPRVLKSISTNMTVTVLADIVARFWQLGLDNCKIPPKHLVLSHHNPSKSYYWACASNLYYPWPSAYNYSL